MSINDLNPTQGQDEEVSQSNEDTATDVQMPDEKTVLLQRARLMGLTVSNNIGLDTLRKKIEDHQAAKDAAAAAPADVPATGDVEGAATETPTKVNPLAPIGSVASQPAQVKARPQSLRQMLMAEQLKLVRVRIQNLDDKKKDLPGEIFTVANEYIGTVRKYIPYGEASDDGYHIPFCIYTMLKDRKFLSIRTGKGKNGTPKVETRWSREFAIEVLPPLTPEELERLAQAQIAAGSTNGD